MKFGSFDDICREVPLTVCSLLGADGNGIEPHCYARNFEFAGRLFFEFAVMVIYIAALVMGVIMIYHIKTKYTAVGRKEMVTFFILYMLTTIVEAVVVSGIIPPSSVIHPWFVAAHVGLLCASVWSLLFNGLVGFQIFEDGTALSVWGIRLSSLIVFGGTFFVAIGTFKNMVGFLSPTNPLLLWVFYFIFNGAGILIYFILQLILVFKTLDDRWPLGDILFAITFFVIGQVVLYVFSQDICVYATHYIDGMFFGVMCSLLSVMMTYKYWDSITKEDLEFSVGGKTAQWDVKYDMGGYNNGRY
ncbi:Chitin synthase, class 7 [Basidiobolus ranarum]|uniref:Chitin synthase export chaperone n=1 Tax=Basidiobolus ranarum TaxID=34480 RepID=A0ABR2W241_9FUNG